MDDAIFYVLFNGISVVSRRRLGNSKRLCAIELRLRLKESSLKQRSSQGPLNSRQALNLLSCRGSYSCGGGYRICPKRM